jgi:hypothetical protein
MKRAILAVFLLTISVMAANVSGRWSGRFRVDGGDHDVPQLLILKQAGNKLTGSGGPDETEQYPIENGTVDGDRVRFEITTGEWKFAYDIKTDGAAMKGSLELKSENDRRTASVSVTKVQ